MENPPADQFQIPVQSQRYVASGSNSLQSTSQMPKINPKLVLVIIIILLVVTLPVGAYFLGKQSSQTRNATVAPTMNSFGAVNSNLNPTPTPTLIPTPTMISTPTASLKPTPTIAASNSGTLIATRSAK